jgi:hypothetical protein
MKDKIALTNPTNPTPPAILVSGIRAELVASSKKSCNSSSSMKFEGRGIDLLHLFLCFMSSLHYCIASLLH